MADGDSKTLNERLAAIEEKLDNLASDDLEMLDKNISAIQEIVARLERLIEYEVVRPIRPQPDLREIRDRLDELLRKIG